MTEQIVEPTAEPTVEPTAERVATEAAADEGADRVRVITFGEGEDATSYKIPRKWKRFKFMRALARNDMAACLDAIWPPTREKDPASGEMVDTPNPVVAEIEDLDISAEEFDEAFERLGHALGGTSAGNSPSSPGSP